MAKITRKNMKIFGSSATANQRAVFGSLNAGSPAYSTDPETIQSLANYLSGWFAAVEGGNSPAIEDMNALQFLYAYQLAYIFQNGVPEWNASTSYYIGSLVSAGDSTGRTYVSLVDDNLNNAITDTTKWRITGQTDYDEFLSDGTWTCPTGVTKVKVSVSTFIYEQLAGANGSALALNSTGSAYGWGANGSGVCGVGDVTPRSSPVLVLGGLKWRGLSQGAGNDSFVLGVSSSGDGYGWGFNTSGQLGIGNVTAQSSPVLVLGGFKWRQISSGGAGAPGGNALGITSSGDLYAWGLNNRGQLGVAADVIPRSSPVIVLGGKKWRQVSVGSSNSYGIDSNGDLYAWGDGFGGALGNGNSAVAVSSPLLVLGGLKWKKVRGSMNGSSFLGIDSNNDLYACGGNTSGELGLGDVTPRSSPVLVLGGLKWRDISIGSAASFGITLDGTAYAWGRNGSGQLGDGTVVAKSSPVAVLGGFKWREIHSIAAVTTEGSAMGITTGALLYAWGNNVSGQLGVGDVTPRSSPILVLGGFNYPAVHEILVNSIVMSVTPGIAYNVAVYGLVALFNYVGLYQDPYNAGAMPLKITVEYEN